MKECENISKPPLLSVVLISPDGFKQIEKTLSHLSNQDIRKFIEVIIITQIRDEFNLELDLKSLFHSYRIIRLEYIINVGHCLAEGFLSASAEIVVYCEDHSYPQPGWASLIVQSHKSEYAAVGWSLVNYNPESIISITSFYTSFGPWIVPVNSSVRKCLASHHISYKVHILKKYRENLHKLLEQETVFQYFLGKRGYKFYLQSGAISKHINITKLSSYLYSEYIGGRIYASNIAMFGNWSKFRKLIYILGSPLRPVSRIIRVINNLNRTGKIADYLPKMFPYLIVSAVVHSIGELIGYILGVGDAYRQNKSIELYRYKHQVN